MAGREASSMFHVPGSRLLIPLAALSELLAEGGRPLIDFLLAQHYLVGADSPGVAMRVLDRPATIAPELVFDGPDHRRTRRYGAVEQCVAIVDVNPQSHRRAAE